VVAQNLHALTVAIVSAAKMDDIRSSLGLVHAYTGNGKGKTTAALGLSMRALEHGLRVHFLQFLKGGSYTGELRAVDRYANFSITQLGKGSEDEPRFEDFEPDTQDRARALRGLELARKNFKDFDVLVLDEVFVAMHLGHISVDEVKSVVDEKPLNVELVLTGRSAPQELLDKADYVTVMQSQQHPFNKGILGRQGIDY